MDALCVIHNSRIDWSFGLCWVLRLAAFVYFHAHMKQDTQMPNMTFHIILICVWIPFNCSRTECIHLIRADSTSDYSTRYCFNHPQMNFIRCLENGADHPNNEGFSWVGPNTIDSSWQISSPSCLRNFTQWRLIWMLQWLHVLDWPVQFTCPRIWQASPSWVTVNVRWICPMWEYYMVGRREFDHMKYDSGGLLAEITIRRKRNLSQLHIWYVSAKQIWQGYPVPCTIHMYTFDIEWNYT